MRCVCLPAALFALAAGLTAQEPKTPKELAKAPEAPKLTKGELEQIDEQKVEDLKRYMSQAHNALSRDGLELLKARAVLRTYQQKASAAVKLYADDPDVAAMTKLFESTAVKKQLGEMLATIKDDKALDEAVVKYLKEQGGTLSALGKYNDARTARTMLQKCDDGLKKIQAALDKPLPGLSADNLNMAGRQGLDRVEAILAKLDNKTPSADAVDSSAGGDLRELLKAALK